MGGGGVPGRGGGIAPGTMTGGGDIMPRCPGFTLMSIPDGEDTTEIISGPGTGGTINGFRPNNCNRTGRAGRLIGIGSGKARGASRTINLDHNASDRN